MEQYEGKVVDIETDVNYVHIVVSLGPRYAIAKIMNVLKGVTARILRRDYGDFIKQYLWKDSFWSDSYFIATTGDVTLDVLKQYVENQGKPKRSYHRKK